MGQYFQWVNADKSEYINPGDFDMGVKLYESSWEPNGVLAALYELLSSDWEGDLIAFVGDYVDQSKNLDNPVAKRLFEQIELSGYKGNLIDYQDEVCKNISGYYKEAEESVRESITNMIEHDGFELNEYKVDPNNPWEGLFVRNGRYFRYTINDAKKEFVDILNTREETVKEKSGEETLYRNNPIPVLMAFGDSEVGRWVGDRIRVSDEKPPKEYIDISEYVKEGLIGNKFYLTKDI